MKGIAVIISLVFISSLCMAQAWGEGGFDAKKDSSTMFYYKNSTSVKKKIFYYRDRKAKAIEFYESIDNPNPTKVKCFYENGKMKEYHSKKTLRSGKTDKVVDIYWDSKGAKKKTVVYLQSE
jgi:hypothetical protein